MAITPKERDQLAELNRAIELAKQDICPKCGGELDTGWECNKCGFDAMVLVNPRDN